MTWVVRTFECGFGHQWDKLVEKGAPLPTECPTCQAIVAMTPPPHEAGAAARSETQGAPAIRGQLTKNLQRFEHGAFVRPHFDDGKPLMTNMRDGVREGETYAVPETVSSNETMRMTADMIQNAERARKIGRNTEGAHLAAIGGGWQSAGAVAPGTTMPVLQTTGGPQNPMGLPSVDLQSKKSA